MPDEPTKKILDAVKHAVSSPRDLSVEEIAEITGIHRNTISKYVYGLEKEGKLVMTRQVGNAKFYTVKEAK